MLIRVCRPSLWIFRSLSCSRAQPRLLHSATVACRQKQFRVSEAYQPPVDPILRWKKIKSGEKIVALWAGVSCVIGYFALKYMSKVAAARKASILASEKCPVLVIAGPSGCGKSTLLKKVFDKYPDKLSFSISHTTRRPRVGEKNGREYNFVTREKMEKAIEDNKFIEWAEFSGNIYGTSMASVQRCQQQGMICVLDIDMQGVRSIKSSELSATCIYIHIKPPSLKVLEERLRARKTDTEDAIKKRLQAARVELDFAATPGMFDHTILNEVLDTAFKDLDDVLCENFGLSETQETAPS